MLGSKYYATHPLYPLKTTLANLNIDGISLWGRTRDVPVIGFGQSSLEDLLLAPAVAQGRKVLPESVATVIQEPQLGTGHAVQVAAPALRRIEADQVLVHYGDEALVRVGAIQSCRTFAVRRINSSRSAVVSEGGSGPAAAGCRFSSIRRATAALYCSIRSIRACCSWDGTFSAKARICWTSASAS